MEELDKLREGGLKECPFCGSEGYMFDDGESFEGMCLNKECDAGCMFKTKEGAIKGWNTRPLEAKLTATIKELWEALECTMRVAGLNGVPELVYMAKQALLRAKQMEICH